MTEDDPSYYGNISILLQFIITLLFLTCYDGSYRSNMTVQKIVKFFCGYTHFEECGPLNPKQKNGF